jgi:hypothetical protein
LSGSEALPWQTARNLVGLDTLANTGKIAVTTQGGSATSNASFTVN